MASIFDIMEDLKRKREASQEGSPVTRALEQTASGLRLISDNVKGMRESLKQRIAADMVARKAGESSDVQRVIREMLNARIAEDRVESERHSRMMEIAEEIVPQVTKEQLDAHREQRELFREQKHALQAQLDMAEATAKVQMDAAKSVADAQTAVIKDKYGTIGSAVSGLEAKAQDPLTRMLLQGVGRLVEGKKGALDKDVAAGAEVKNKRIGAALAERKEDLQEASAVSMARAGLKDPGSAAELYKQRDKVVADIAAKGKSIEAAVLSGKPLDAVALPGKKLSEKGAKVSDAEKIVADASPAVKRAIAGEWTAVERSPEATVSVPSEATVSVPSEGTKFKKSPVQPTALVTPSATRTPPANGRSVATGAFGSKAGAANMGGLGKALGGIVSSMGSLAGSAIKFLGPWGLAANSIMSIDRMVPLVSTAAGALTDVTKLAMPLLVSTMMEGFSSLLEGINGVVDVLDNSFLGRKWGKDTALQARIASRTAELEGEASARKNEEMKAATGGVIKNTTSVLTGGARASAVLRRNEGTLTSPSEAASLSAIAPTTRNTLAETARNDQVEQNRALREAVLAAAKNPGTTPVVTANPSLAPWPV